MPPATALTRFLPSQPATLHEATLLDLHQQVAIVGSAAHLLAFDPGHDRRDTLLNTIGAAAARSGDLAAHLLGAASAGPDVQRFDLNSHLIGRGPLIRALTHGIAFDLCSDPIPVRLDRARLDAALFELLAAVRDAGSTAMTLRTRRRGPQAALTVAGDSGEASLVAAGQNGSHPLSAFSGGTPRTDALASAAHGRLMCRSRAARGHVATLILPTVLRLAAVEPRAVIPHVPQQSKEKNREKD